MKYVISNSQLVTVAQLYVLDQLKEMDFKKFKNKDFEFFPKGNHSASHGIKADWSKEDKGYHILVGFTLWKSVQDLFNLDMEETRSAFHNAFTDLKLTPIIDLDTIDVYEIEKIMGLREEFNQVKTDDKLKSIIKKFIMKTFTDVYDVRFGSKNVMLGSSSGTPTITKTIIIPIINNSENKMSGAEIRSLGKEIINTVNGMFGLNIDEYGSEWEITCVQLAIVGVDTTIRNMK